MKYARLMAAAAIAVAVVSNAIRGGPTDSPTQSRASIAPQNADDWVARWGDVVALAPDAEVVTDAGARNAIASTGLPWRVRERISGIELVLIPPGKYLRGASKDDVHGWERQHEVVVAHPFYLGVTEVTQAQWKRVMHRNPSTFEGDRRPVETVSYDDIQPFLEATSLTLPRDTEWEYACRAGTTTAWPAELATIACHGRHADAGTCDVASLRPNAWGLFDMLGNVWELTRTWYLPYPRGEGPIDARDEDDNFARLGRVTPGLTLRGGSYGGAPEHVRSAIRVHCPPDRRSKAHGFRVSKDIPIGEDGRPTFAPPAPADAPAGGSKEREDASLGRR